MKPKKSDYSAKLLDPRWQKKRLKVLDRDDFTCQVCGATDKTLHVHHSHYRSDAEGPWDYEDASLVTVCYDCHEGEHENFGDMQKSLFEMVCKAGFATSDSQMDLVSTFNFLCGASKEDRDGLLDSMQLFVANRAVRLGLRYGDNLLAAIKSEDGVKNA